MKINGPGPAGFPWNLAPGIWLPATGTQPPAPGPRLLVSWIQPPENWLSASLAPDTWLSALHQTTTRSPGATPDKAQGGSCVSNWIIMERSLVIFTQKIESPGLSGAGAELGQNYGAEPGRNYGAEPGHIYGAGRGMGDAWSRNG